MLMVLLHVWLMSAAVMTIAWYFSMRVKNVGYVDVVWAGLMAAAAVMVSIEGDGSDLPRALVAFLGGIWGARLCIHLLKRVMHEPEDGRYQALRATWNGSPAKFFAFFQMQAVIVVLFSIPFYAGASRYAGGICIWTLAAIGIWMVSVFGEYLADQQLAKFRANPDNKGTTCRTGLWAYSRHPNYFFEWLHWFTYVFLAIHSEYFWYSLVGPIVMLAFLYRVSGIPWTETQALRSRGDDYRRYQNEVSAFIPWLPRKSSATPKNIN
jgi:steroid 5-alpha reductase family enzyme